MTTPNPTQHAQAFAANMGKRLSAFIQSEVKKAGDAGDIRIDAAQAKAAMAHSTNMRRHDVPRHAYDKDGNRVPLPEVLKDEFNPMYRDAQGIMAAARYLPGDLNRVNTSPSPAQPLKDMREVWPVLALVPAMAFAPLLHWVLVVAALMVYAICTRTSDRVGVFGNLWYIVFGTTWKTGIFLGPIFLYLVLFAPGWLASSVLPLWMCIKAYWWLLDRQEKADPNARAKALFGQVQHLTRTGFATQTADEDIKHVAARQEQANAVAADTAPRMDIDATATGYFTGRGSLNSPDEGKNMTFTGTNIGPGMLAFGTSGTGKTHTFLRPVMKEVARASKAAAHPSLRYGVFLMCQKGDLPPEGMAIFPGYRLISPEDYIHPKTGEIIKASSFAPMQGLNAEQVTQLIGDIFSTTGVIWDKASEEFFLYLAIAMECAKSMGLKFVPMLDKDGKATGKNVEVKWNLETLFRLAISDAQVNAVLKTIAAVDQRTVQQGRPSPVAQHPLMDKSFAYFKDNYNKLAENTRSSVKFTISSWITDSVNRHILPWMEAEEGVRVEDVFKGESMGLYCPEARYGKTATLMLAIVRARLYNFAKNRAGGWEVGGTQAMIIWDEFALGIGKGTMEAQMAPIQRSLGLSVILATQTIEQVRTVMGREAADTLLDNYTKNVVCFSSSAATYEYLADKLGTYRALVPSSRSKEAPVAIDYYGTLRAKELAGTPGVTYYDQERLENKQTKAAPSMFDKGLFNVRAIGAGQDSNTLYKNVPDADVHTRYIEAGLLSMEEAKVFDPNEMSRYLAFKFHAFFCMDIGGQRRYDVVHLGPKNTPKTTSAANDAQVKKTA